jgi:hypothetical protein
MNEQLMNSDKTIETVFDSIRPLQQEAFRTFEEISRFTKLTRRFGFENVIMEPSTFKPNGRRGSGYQIQIGRNTYYIQEDKPSEPRILSKLISIIQRKKIERKPKSTESKQKIKVFVDRNSDLTEYLEVKGWKKISGIDPYFGDKWVPSGDQLFTDVPDYILKNQSLEGAKAFTYACKEIQELPSRIVSYINSTAKEVNRNRVPDQIEDTDLYCGTCSAPNTELKLFCKYCQGPMKEAISE